MYQKTVLDNGLRIVTEGMPQTNSVSICIFAGVGSRYEKDKVAGVSHFIEHLLFRGTDKRPETRLISEAIEGVGGVLNGGTDKELTVYWCKVPAAHFTTAVDVLADMLLHARFEPSDIEKERQIILEEIKMNYDNPGQRVNQLIDGSLWYGSPLGRDVAGSKKTVSAITREELLEYKNMSYLPSNAVVAIAGNVGHDEAVRAVSEYLGCWGNRKHFHKFKSYQLKECPHVKIEKRKIEQAHLCLALPGLSRFDAKRYHLDMLNIILGVGMSSRLFNEVRDKLGLAYTITSYAEHLSDTGSLIVYAGVEPGKLSTAIKVILEQMAIFTRKKVSDEELAKAREMAKGRLLLRMEENRHVASWLGTQEILSNRILTVDDVVAIIDAVTASDIMRIAKELMVSERLKLAVVGPVNRDEPLDALLRFG
ncbi:MAG: insulinase family protein [Dehalococcoidales bacterium]|nr:insulinase family protein [Dehalococcoidales bacterium]